MSLSNQRLHTDNARRRDGIDSDHVVPGDGSPGGKNQETEKSAKQIGRDAAERVQVAVGPVERGGPDAARRPQDGSLHVDGAVDVAREEPAHGHDAVERGEQHRDDELLQDYGIIFDRDPFNLKINRSNSIFTPGYFCSSLVG